MIEDKETDNYEEGYERGIKDSINHIDECLFEFPDNHSSLKCAMELLENKLLKMEINKLNIKIEKLENKITELKFKKDK